MQGISQFERPRPIVVPQARNPWADILPNLVSGIVGQVLQNKLTEGVKEQAANEKLALAGWREIPAAPTEGKESGAMDKVMGFLGVGGKQDAGENPLPGTAQKFGNKWYLPPAVKVDEQTGIVTEGPNIKMRIPVDKTIPLPGMTDASGKQVYGTTADLLNLLKTQKDAAASANLDAALVRGEITPEKYFELKKLKADAEKGTPGTPKETPSSASPGTTYYTDEKGNTHVVQPPKSDKPSSAHVIVKGKPGESSTGYVYLYPDGTRIPEAVPVGPLGVIGAVGDALGGGDTGAAETPSSDTQRMVPGNPTKVVKPIPQPAVTMVPLGTSPSGQKVYRSSTPDKNGKYQYFTDE